MARLNKTVIASHILGWIAFISLPVLFITGGSSASRFADIVGSWIYWLFFIIYAFVFYFHRFVLIPELLNKKRYASYVLSLLVFLTVIIFVKPFDKLAAQSGGIGPARTEVSGELPGKPPPQGFEQPDRKLRPPGDQRRIRFDIISVFLFVLIILMGLSIDSIERLKEAREKAAKAEADKANAELAFLKAQINPHFLFNTLNNIYSMAVTSNEKTGDSIMKLSNIMRYVTDEVQQDFVPLESEVECVSDYVALNSLRLGEKVKINYLINGDPGSKIIAPLLLMPFVENVFKYGVSNHEPVEILIHLNISDDRVELVTKNKIVSFVHKAERTGIGIENTKARLRQVYPDKHELEISAENNFYHLRLNIFF